MKAGNYHEPSNNVRPSWWALFWLISVFDIGMVLLMMYVPDYAALWAVLLVSLSGAAGFAYKGMKTRLDR